MTEHVPVVAEVMSFDASGFADHTEAGFSRFPAATLRIEDPQSLLGRTVTLVLDRPVNGFELLTVPTTRVRFRLDSEAVGLDVLFAGALVDAVVHRLAQDPT